MVAPRNTKMYQPKFWIFMSFLSLVNTYTFSKNTNCQTSNSTEIKKISIDSHNTESIKPHKIFEVMINFFNVFSQNEKSLNLTKIHSPVKNWVRYKQLNTYSLLRLLVYKLWLQLVENWMIYWINRSILLTNSYYKNM